MGRTADVPGDVEALAEQGERSRGQRGGERERQKDDSIIFAVSEQRADRLSHSCGDYALFISVRG